MSKFSSLNKVQLIGRLGRDPKKNYSATGTAIVNFSIATTESEKIDGTWKERTEWHDVVCFGNLAENVASFTSKGLLVYVEGSLKKKSWTGRDGQEKTGVEITAREVKFLESSKTETPKKDNPPIVDDTPDDDDLPF